MNDDRKKELISMIRKLMPTIIAQDIVGVEPIKNMLLDEGRIHGARYYTVEPIGGDWLKYKKWCTEVFGPISSIWNTETIANPPIVCGRWYMNARKIWFRDEKDRTMFILKWT